MERITYYTLLLLMETTQGNNFIFTICDYCTRWVDVFAITDNKAFAIVDILLDVFLWFGVPRCLITIQHWGS